MKTQISNWRKGWLAVSMIVLCSCQDDAQIRSLGEQIRALESSQAQAKAEMNRLQLQMRSVQAERDKLKEEKDKFQSQLDEATKALEAIQNDFAEYKNQYKLSIRKRAPGMELDMVEVDGKKFEKVKIRELTDTALIFMHQAGTMSVPLNQLKPEMQVRLGFEQGVPVMAGIKGGRGQSSGMALDQEMDQVEKRIALQRTKLSNLQRNAALENLKAHNASFKQGGDPTIHRQAVAAMQVQINEVEVELNGLVKRRSELANDLRMKQLRQ
jgi:predicted RNase H-like nuclease (RuvC/YqgF family)